MKTFIILASGVEGAGAIIAVSLLMIGVIALAFWFQRKQMHATWDHFILLGQQFGITVVKPQIGFFGSKLARLNGPIRSTQLEIYTERRGSGKHTYYYTIINLRLPVNPMVEFKLAKEGFFQKIGKALGMQDIPTGNDAFDKAFVLKSSQPDRVLQFFDLHTTNFLASQENVLRSAITLRGNELHYEEQTMITNADRLAHITAVTNVVLYLGEKVVGRGARA